MHRLEPATLRLTPGRRRFLQPRRQAQWQVYRRAQWRHPRQYASQPVWVRRLEPAQFDLRPLGSGFYNIVARHSGSCLSVDNAVIKANTLVRQFRCNGSNEQIFRLGTVTAQLPPNTAPRPANCRSASATDETRYASGVQYAPMTVRFCEIRKNDYRMSMFYGRPTPNGQPTGKLFFQSRLNANSQTMKGSDRGPWGWHELRPDQLLRYRG